MNSYQGFGVVGVQIDLGDGKPAATTDAEGRWWCVDLMPGTYTVRPHRGNWAFDPPSREITVSKFDVSRLKFTLTGPRQTESEWVHTWTADRAGFGVDIAADASGNVYTLSDLGVLLKYDNTGKLAWTYRLLPERLDQFSYNSNELATSLVIRVNGEIYVGGSLPNSNNDHPGFIIRLTPDGAVEWMKELTLWDLADIAIYNNGDLALAGLCEVEGAANGTPTLTVLSPAGDLLRSVTFVKHYREHMVGVAVNTVNDACLAFSIIEETESGYLTSLAAACIGETNSLRWASTWSCRDGSWATSIAADQDGNFYLAGSTSSEVASTEQKLAALIAFDGNGNLRWQHLANQAESVFYELPRIVCVGLDSLYLCMQISDEGFTSYRNAIVHIQAGVWPVTAQSIAHPGTARTFAMALGPTGELLLSGMAEDASCFWDETPVTASDAVGICTPQVISLEDAGIEVITMQADTEPLTGIEDRGESESSSGPHYNPETVLTVKHTP